MTGSCSAGALNGRCAEPSASTTMSRSGCASPSIVPGSNPSHRPRVPSPATSVTAPHASSAAAQRTAAVRSSASITGGTGSPAGRVNRTVVVTTTGMPASCASKASRNTRLVLPPLPTAATTDPGPAPSASSSLMRTILAVAHVTQFAALILAGGRSTRFGSDKASALLQGRPLLQWVIDAAVAGGAQSLVVVRAPGQRLPASLAATVTLVELDDEFPGGGPLAGLATGLAHIEAPFAFAASCDVPLLQPALIRRLAELAAAARADVVMPRVGGFPQPLVAVYRPAACAPAFRQAIQTGSTGGRIVPACSGLHVLEPGEAELRAVDPDLRSFLNANTPARLDEISRLLEGPLPPDAGPLTLG